MQLEKSVNIKLSHIIDPTLLRALKLIHNEDDIEGYFVDGLSTISLTIKLKQKEGKVTSLRDGREKL